MPNAEYLTPDLFKELTAKEIDFIADTAVDDFDFFTHFIFALSTDVFKNKEFTTGEFLHGICDWMGGKQKTLRVSAKDHFKSFSFYAHIMWKIHQMFFLDESREIQYFSYKDSMAAYHLAKIKEALDCNPFFENLIDLKPRAEGVLAYNWLHGNAKLTADPRGLLGFKRGIHCNDIYVDDPFQDPENKLVPTKVKKINDVMKNQILDMFQNELHIAGTAQTPQDFFFDPDFTHRFSVKILPAVINEERKEVLWKEWMSFDELMAKKRERGEKIFAQEYLCSPVYSQEAYLNHGVFDALVNASLKNYKFEEWRSYLKKREAEEKKNDFDVLAGFDIGKKTHPSHLAVFANLDGKGKKWTQIHSKWMDGWDYTRQLEYLEEAIDAFRIDRLPYDNTRSEFEALDEEGALPGEMEPVSFTFKSKNSMAAQLDRLVSAKAVEFLDDKRQNNQIKVVTNDLQAPESVEGHGDSFWSVCLAFYEHNQGVDITFV